MTVLDPSRLNLRMPEIDATAAAESARTSFDRVADLARDAVAGLELDRHADDLGQKVRDVVQTHVVTRRRSAPGARAARGWSATATTAPTSAAAPRPARSG